MPPDDDKNILGGESAPAPDESLTFAEATNFAGQVWDSLNPVAAVRGVVIDSIVAARSPDVTLADALTTNATALYEDVQDLNNVATRVVKGEDLKSALEHTNSAKRTADEQEAADLAQGIEHVPETAAEASQRTRFAEQCYLMYNVTELAKYHLDSMKDPATLAPSVTPLPLYTYRKTHMLDTQQASTVISKLTMRPGTEILADATPSTLANLVPKLSLYKVYYRDDEDQTVVDCEIPFKFYNHTITSDDVLNDIGLPDESIVVDEPAIHRTGAGIKSFDWNYISSNPATIRNDITAKLVLFFQDMEELFKPRKHTVITGVGDDAEADIKSYRYLDLIVHAPPRSVEGTIEDDSSDGVDCDGVAKKVYDSSFFEIKANVGWAAPGGLSTSEKEQELLESVNYNQTPIFLSLVDHEFSIAEDGTFQLTIQYRGRLEGILGSPKSNILWSGGAGGIAGDESPIMMDGDGNSVFAQIIAMEDQIDEINEKKTQCEANKKRRESLSEAIIALKDELRLTQLQSIETDLLRPSWAYSELNDKKLMHQLPVTNDIIRKFRNKGVSDEDGEFGVLTASDVEVDAAGGVPDHAPTENLIQNFFRNLTGAWEYDVTSAALKDNLAGYDFINQWDPDDTSTHVLNFFYLGDLIDLLAIGTFNNTEDFFTYGGNEKRKKKYAFKKSEVEHLRILLGPFEYKDPRTGEVLRVNISDIPVSWRSFVDFFHRNVIKPQKDVYRFGSFIKDLVKDLATVALGADCFHDVQQQRSNFRLAQIEGPAMEGEDAIKSQWLRSKKGSGEIGDSEIAQAGTVRLELDNYGYDTPVFPQNNYGKSLKDFWQYIVIFAQGPSGLVHPHYKPNSDKSTSARTIDLYRGIQHLHIGRDRGLVKTIKFKKTDAPALREARYEKSGDFDPMMQLSNVYEGTISMVGNTFFYPGSYVYINPFGLAPQGTLGQPYTRDSNSNIMGLGGYHIIINVESFIESGKFETIVKTRFDTTGDGCRITNVNEDQVGACEDEFSAGVT